MAVCLSHVVSRCNKNKRIQKHIQFHVVYMCVQVMYLFMQILACKDYVEFISVYILIFYKMIESQWGEMKIVDLQFNIFNFFALVSFFPLFDLKVHDLR